MFCDILVILDQICFYRFTVMDSDDERRAEREVG